MTACSPQPDLARERSIPLRARSELVALSMDCRGRRRWRLKDPVSLEYFQLEDEEYVILKMLDGRTSLAQIKQHFDARFAPRHVSLSQLQAYLAHLYHACLVQAETPDQGHYLLTFRRSASRRERAAAFINPLAIRFRGIDPEAFLHGLYPRVSWLFSPWSALVSLFIVAAAGMLVMAQWDKFSERLPEFRAFLTPAGFVWLAVALAGTKILHELGHALACRHFGGECHEMGVMLLVFTPCLYCNVSDAWMIAEKWRRVVISAAGIAVEAVLAAVCLFLWWLSEPGLLHSVAFNVVLVCSIGTLVFNGNPLLRYDGYYILSDALDLPNLAEQSTLLVKRTIWGWLTGRGAESELPLSTSARRWLAIYAALSAAYRLVVLSTILWFCWRLFADWNLKILGGLLVTIVVAGFLVPSASALAELMRDPLQRRQLDPLRLRRALAIAACLLAAGLLLPLPQRVTADVVLQAADAQRVHVTVPGQLIRCLAAGSLVRAGDVVAELDNPALRREIDKLVGERDLLILRCKNLDSRRADDAEAAAQIPTAAEELAQAEERLRQRQNDFRRLTLTAPIDGEVLPPPDVPELDHEGRELRIWSRTPMEDRNIGCWLDAGTVLCIIGRPRSFDALVVIGQSEIELVRTGQSVRIQLDQLPGTILTGTVTEIAEVNLESILPELIGARDTAILKDRSGNLRPADTSYQARVTLNDENLPLSLRARGRAKISVDASPLGPRLYRLFRETFHFRR